MRRLFLIRARGLHLTYPLLQVRPVIASWVWSIGCNSPYIPSSTSIPNSKRARLYHINQCSLNSICLPVVRSQGSKLTMFLTVGMIRRHPEKEHSSPMSGILPDPRSPCQSDFASTPSPTFPDPSETHNLYTCD